MTKQEKERIELAEKHIITGTWRILIGNCYEGYELKEYKAALKYLLEEAEKK